jgi:hypothetical protein
VSATASVGSLGVSAGVGVGVGTQGTAPSSPSSPQAAALGAPLQIQQAGVMQLVLPLPVALRPTSQDDRHCDAGGSGSGCRTAALQQGRASLDANESPRPTKQLSGKRGTPATIVAACQTAAAKAAAVYGATSVQAASAGKADSTGNGGVVAPVNIRVAYPGGMREARVSCSVNAGGLVTALI